MEALGDIQLEVKVKYDELKIDPREPSRDYGSTSPSRSSCRTRASGVRQPTSLHVQAHLSTLGWNCGEKKTPVLGLQRGACSGWRISGGIRIIRPQVCLLGMVAQRHGKWAVYCGVRWRREERKGRQGTRGALVVV
eukprot:1327153-Amorphochlora_amoeboformis.AAC.1